MVCQDVEEQRSEWGSSYLNRKSRTLLKQSNIWCYLHSNNKEGLQTSEKNTLICLTLWNAIIGKKISCRNQIGFFWVVI